MTTYNFPLLRADLIEYYQEELFSFGLVAFTKVQEAKDADEYVVEKTTATPLFG